MSGLPIRPSNRADWSGSIHVREHGTGDPVDCTTATDLVVELEDPDTCSAVLTASFGNGVSAVDVTRGEFAFTFPAARMVAVRPKTYLFAGIIKDASRTLQLFRVEVSAYDGVVG